MRIGLLASAAVGLLVAAYAAAGYWLAPRFVRDALLAQASRIGLELRLGKVRTDPFAFSVALSDIEVLAPDGRKLASALGASVDLAWASLWGPAWIVQEASLQQPVVEVTLGAFGGKNKNAAPVPALEVRHLAISEGTLQVIDRSREAPVELRIEALGLELTGLSTQSSAPAHYEIAARIAGGGTVSSQGSLSLEPLAARGKLDVAGAALATLWQLAAPGTQPVRGELRASAAYDYRDGRLLLEALSAKASADRGGSVAASGSVALQPLAADLQLEVADLALAHAQPWLPQQAAIKIASGTLSAKGRLRLRPGDVTYEGDAAVSDARFDALDSDKLLLGWQRLETDDAKLRFAPFAVEIGELVARAPKGRLIIEADGSVNFADAIRPSQDRHDGKPLQAAVRRLRIENGTLEFADRSLDNDFAVMIRELSGAITGFSTLPGDPARVQLAGRVQKYGSATIRGTIDLDAPRSLANISATFRNLDMAALTPYIVKFAGYRVESGRLSADLRYRVRDGGLVGENQFVIERLQLGEKVESATALDLPIGLAIALLSDSQGRIDLGIPVRGDLNDPQFDLGGLIAKAIGNVIGKIASAPFRALGALFGGGDKDLDQVRFEPGSVALAPPQEENVARVAKALIERPQLGVSIRGGYDPESDVAAMRRQAVRREIAQRAGYEANRPLDFGDLKLLHAAENLYLERRVGNRLELQSLREGERSYGRLLVDKLADAKAGEPGTAETLAGARAEAVRAALLKLGVDPSRVRLEATAPEAAGKEGVATVLTLRADLPAQQQAVRVPGAKIADEGAAVGATGKAADVAPAPVD